MPVLREWRGDHATIEELRALTHEDAAAIYRALWWDRYGYGRLSAQDVATKLLDVSVNMGPSRAHSLAQEAAQRCGHPSLIADGVLGPASVAAINACDPRAWLMAMCRVQREWYARIIAARPQLEVFRSGWGRRAAWPFSAEAVA